MSEPSHPARVPARARRESPLGGRKPLTSELAAFQGIDANAVDDILPVDLATVRLLVVGVNPGLWTAAVNAPFARPGNRFWPSLHRAGFTDHVVDASRGLLADDEQSLLRRGIAITNLVGRATVRADELSRSELQAGGRRLVDCVRDMRPDAVAVAGITAYRTAFALPKAVLGRQDVLAIDGWPEGVDLWVVPQPSGLNAHETIDSLAAKWREVWDSLPPE